MEIKRFIRHITAILLVASALFIFLSLNSYSPNDPPFADYPVNSVISNFCGTTGAQISGYLMAGLGKSSYWVAILLLWLGVAYLFKENVEYFWVKIIGATLSQFSLASALTLGCYLFKNAFISINVGGLFGFIVASRLCEYLSPIGAIIILALAFIVSIMLLLNTTPISMFNRNSKEDILKLKNIGALYHPKLNVPKVTDNLTNNYADSNPTDTAIAAVEAPVESLEMVEDVHKSSVQEQPSAEEEVYNAEVFKDKEKAYELPQADLLVKPTAEQLSDDWDQISQRAQVLKNALEQFNVNSEVVGIERGPVIAMYELELAPGTKVGKVVGLSDDLAIALKAPSVRIVAPLLGKSSIGVEVPNIQRKPVLLRELIDATGAWREKMAIPLLIGKDVAGNPVISDLAAMPHLLIAGTTGSGKSVCLNSVILSILFLRHPSDVQLLLVDPKMVEFSAFREIPHLISPVVTDMKKAAAVLEWAVNKMEERYALLASVGVKHIYSYNKLGIAEIKKRLNPEGDSDLDGVPLHLPYIVIVVDELADLMMVASKEVEASIIRLSQKSRAVGIHLILATQRPSVDVITGLIKSNLPSRISFYVASKVDSRTILDQNGAEKLLGSGDMLFLLPGTSKLVRVQGAYVSDEEVKNVVEYLSGLAAPQFSSELKSWKGVPGKDSGAVDDLYNDAVRIILESQRGSVSLLQRRLEIGYSRAAKLIELMAEAGLVGEYKGSQAREVFLTLEEWDEQMASENQGNTDNA